MDVILYSLDEISKSLLLGLEGFGRQVTFGHILVVAGHHVTNERQMEIAVSLEALGLIQNVSYQLPLRIRGELSQAGISIVNALKTDHATTTAPPQRRQRPKAT